MRIIASIFLLFVLSAGGEEPRDARMRALIEKLDHEDFDVRDGATKALVEGFPVVYAERYLEISLGGGVSLEARRRLRVAARRLFTEKAIPLMEEYRRTFGFFGGEIEGQWSEYEKTDDGGYIPTAASKYVGMKVSRVFPFGPLDGKIRPMDVIVEVDGDPARVFYGYWMVAEWGLVEAGRTYRFKVRRYKNLDQIRKRDSATILPGDPYETVEISIQAGRKKMHELNRRKLRKLRKLIDSSWEDFVRRVNFRYLMGRREAWPGESPEPD